MPAMSLQTKQVGQCIKKVLRSSIRTSYKCVSEHPILFSSGVLLYLLYRSSPGFFAFLISSSPVIICTTLLLGILLSYGDTNFLDVNNNTKTTPGISAFKVGNSSSDVHFEANQRISAPDFGNNTTDFQERETKRVVSVRDRSSEHIELDDDVPLLRRVDEQEEIFERPDRPQTLTPFPSMVKFRQEVGVGEDLLSSHRSEFKDSPCMMDKADTHTSLFEGVLSGLNEKDAPFGMFSSSEMAENLNQGSVSMNSVASEVRDNSEEKSTEGVDRITRPTCAVSVRQRKKVDVLKIDTSKVVEDNLLDSSLGSPWARVGSQDDSSGFDSDRAESSSPDASMTDIAPILDEIDPLLGADSSRPDPIQRDDLDTDSDASSQDHRTDDSNDEDGNNDAKNSGEENSKDEGKKAAFIWTADDEKNLMDLGYSELERNKRLEILMVRRRSRKNIRFEIDNNLIDVDSNDAGRSVDDTSRSPLHLPHISVPRRNPFDFPYDPEVPSSAPSFFSTQKNPFDLPFKQPNDSGLSGDDNLSSGESVRTSHRDMFFRRQASVNFGSTYATQERRLSTLKPYFVPETADGSTTNFQRQFSDMSESKLSSVTESDMASSVADQEDHKNLDEKSACSEHESPSLLRQDSDLADAGSECSDGVNSVDVELDHNDITDREISLQHFVFERSQEREAYLSSTKGKGCEEEYMLTSAGNSMTPLHPVADLLIWEDADGESCADKSSLEPNATAEFSEWVLSSRLAEERESASGDLGLGASDIADKDENDHFMPHSNNEIPFDNLIHGSMELLPNFGNETLPVISRDLHPIPEERVVENYNMQDHKTAIFTGSISVLNDLHVIEEGLEGHFDIGSEVSPISVVASLCPPEASDSVGSPPVEPKDISNPFISMVSEPDRVDTVKMKEETTSGYNLDSDDDADKIYPEPIEDNVIDESFLSELDAVGDFQVEPMRLDQQVADLGCLTHDPANGIAEDSLMSPQTSANISSIMSDDSALDSGELSMMVDDLNGTNADFGWSLGTSRDDLEQTVYKPRHRILEGSSVEAMNTELKQPCDETELPSVGTPSVSYLAAGSGELEVTEDGPVTTKTDAEMKVVDAKSLEDIEAAFKQVSTVHAMEREITEDGPVTTKTDAEMKVVDAKSLEDIEAAFKQVSTVHAMEREVMEDGPVTTKTDAEMKVVDAKSLEDIEAAFKQVSTVHAMEREDARERR